MQRLDCDFRASLECRALVSSSVGRPCVVPPRTPMRVSRAALPRGSVRKFDFLGFASSSAAWCCAQARLLSVAISTRQPTQVYRPRVGFPTVEEAPMCLTNAGALLTVSEELLRSALVAVLCGHVARYPFRSYDNEIVEHPNRLSRKCWSHLQ